MSISRIQTNSGWVVVKEHTRSRPGEGQQKRRKSKKKRKKRGAVSYL